MFNIIRSVECIILAAFFGFVPVLFFLLITLIIASALFGTRALGPWTLWSFVPASVYLFYSIIGLGMCMGIPLVSFTLGIAAGLYAARRMQFVQADEQTRKNYFKKTAIFSASVMTLMCCLITLWAIAGQMIGYKIDTFTITAPIFLVIVLTGGALAVALQYFVTLAAAKLMLKLSSSSRGA